MQQSELKREDLKSKVDHLIALVNRHKHLFEVYLKLIQEDHDLESIENARPGKLKIADVFMTNKN